MSATAEPTYLRPALATALGSVFCGLLVTCGFAASGGQNGSIHSAGGLLAAGVRTWLVSHGSGLSADGVVLDAVPLGASLLAALLVMALALRSLAGKEEPIDAVPYCAVTAATYGVAAGVLSAASNHGGYSTPFVRSVIGAVLVAGAGAALATVISAGSLKGTPDGPGVVRSVLRAAAGGAAVLLAAALSLLIVLFALGFGRASDMWASLDPGLWGSLGVAGLCLAVLPNLVLWTTAALLGPGFALGVDTSVDLSGAHLGAVPGLPILAGLPAPGSFPGWVFLLGLIPVLAGAQAGWTAAGVARAWSSRLSLGAAAGALAGLGCGVLIAVSGGAIGPGRMAVTGPPALASLLVAVAVLAFGGLLGAGLRVFRQPVRDPGNQ